MAVLQWTGSGTPGKRGQAVGAGWGGNGVITCGCVTVDGQWHPWQTWAGSGGWVGRERGDYLWLCDSGRAVAPLADVGCVLGELRQRDAQPLAQL